MAKRYTEKLLDDARGMLERDADGSGKYTGLMGRGWPAHGQSAASWVLAAQHHGAEYGSPLALAIANVKLYEQYRLKGAL